MTFSASIWFNGFLLYRPAARSTVTYLDLSIFDADDLTEARESGLKYVCWELCARPKPLFLILSVVLYYLTKFLVVIDFFDSEVLD